MKIKLITLFYLLLSFIFNPSSFGQGGTWTWISGDSAFDSPGVYGTQGMPSINNHPPGTYESCEWKDKQGNFWIYGGTYPNNSDLWKFNPVTKEWTWVKGNGGINEPPVYGSQGVSDTANTPGNRSYCAATWVDASGALWLFGGVNENDNNKNDLWKYDISTNQWTWINGDSTINASGAYGTQGIPSFLNTPGARTETSSAWTDSLNNLWLFGGYGYSSDSIFGTLNDLWKYDINANQWTWMKGSDSINASPNYGIKGIPHINNDPGARFSHTKWKDKQGNFWIMGGGGGSIGVFGPDSIYNDVWKYDLNLNEWTWMSGPDIANDTGNYQSNCIFDTVGHPFSRSENRSSVIDNCGRFWLFGGFTSGSELNDLWVFDPQQLQWNWISGTNVGNLPGNFGTLGISSPSNIPPSLGGANAWWGNDNKFYLFGGMNRNFIVTITYSDVWVFSPDTNCVPVCNSIILPVASFQTSTISIYPNPATNELLINGNWQIETGKLKLTIFNILGEAIYFKELNSKPETVNCKFFPVGIYFIQVSNESSRWTGKFVKE